MLSVFLLSRYARAGIMAEILELAPLYTVVSRRSSGCTSGITDALVRCAVPTASTCRHLKNLYSSYITHIKSLHIIYQSRLGRPMFVLSQCCRVSSFGINVMAVNLTR